MPVSVARVSSNFQVGPQCGAVRRAYHRVSTRHGRRSALHDDSSSRRLVTLASGRPSAAPLLAATPTLSLSLSLFLSLSVSCLSISSSLLQPAVSLSVSLSLFLSRCCSRCSVQTETPSVCALASLVGQDRTEQEWRRGRTQHSLIPASGTWNRTALCFSSQRLAAVAPSFSRGRSAPRRWVSEESTLSVGGDSTPFWTKHLSHEGYA